MSAIEIFIFVFSLIHSFEFVCLFDLVPVFHCKINHLHNINRVWFELVFFFLWDNCIFSSFIFFIITHNTPPTISHIHKIKSIKYLSCFTHASSRHIWWFFQMMATNFFRRLNIYLSAMIIVIFQALFIFLFVFSLI